MDIFISGCAKTRTTLVQWLFTAFKNTVIMPGECRYNIFRCSGLHYDKPDINIVAKRTRDSILSDRIQEELFRDQISQLNMDGVKLVLVTRNKEDTLKSSNNYVSPERYEVCERQAEMLKSLIDIKIDSDFLIKNPDLIQEETARMLGLEIQYKWSTWPDFAPKDQMCYIRYPKIFNRLGQ